MSDEYEPRAPVPNAAAPVIPQTNATTPTIAGGGLFGPNGPDPKAVAAITQQIVKFQTDMLNFQSDVRNFMREEREFRANVKEALKYLSTRK